MATTSNRRPAVRRPSAARRSGVGTADGASPAAMAAVGRGLPADRFVAQCAPTVRGARRNRRSQRPIDQLYVLNPINPG